MEQALPPSFQEYVLGAAVPAGFVVHQGLVITLPIYQVLRLAKVQAPLKLITCIRHILTLSYRFLQEKKMTIFKCGSKTAVNKIHQYHILQSTGSERQVTF